MTEDQVIKKLISTASAEIGYMENASKKTSMIRQPMLEKATLPSMQEIWLILLDLRTRKEQHGVTCLSTGVSSRHLAKTMLRRCWVDGQHIHLRLQTSIREITDFLDLAAFKTTKCFGEYGSIVIDEDAGVFAAISDSAASLFGERKEITDIAQIIDRNPDVVRFDQVTDVDIDIVQTQREEKQTVNGQQVSYNPKHILYMYMFYAVIKLDHPYIPMMRIQLNNDAVQIPNEGERLSNKIGLRLAAYLLDLPIRDVRETERIYSNNSLKDVLLRNPYAMPDYSYGFKCSLRNWDGIQRYGYYLLMTREILETLRR